LGVGGGNEILMMNGKRKISMK
jgi:hypothetical protein